MASKRFFPASLTLVLAMSVQAAHGAPLRVVAELRAAKCCADVCHHERSRGAARHCCQVAQDDPGARPAGRELPPPPLAPVVLDRAAPDLGPPFSGLGEDLPDPRGRAAPLFLLTRTLRL